MDDLIKRHMTADKLARIFSDAGGSDALVNLLDDCGLESSRELADRIEAQEAEIARLKAARQMEGTFSSIIGELASLIPLGLTLSTTATGKDFVDYFKAQAAEIARYRKTLTECRAQFDFYAREHRKAEKHDKAATNERFALLISQALQEPK